MHVRESCENEYYYIYYNNVYACRYTFFQVVNHLIHVSSSCVSCDGLNDVHAIHIPL